MKIVAFSCLLLMSSTTHLLVCSHIGVFDFLFVCLFVNLCRVCFLRELHDLCVCVNSIPEYLNQWNCPEKWKRSEGGKANG